MACKHGNRRPVKRGANSPVDPWQHGHEGGAERGDRRVFIAGLTPGSAHSPLHRETAWLGVGLRAD